MSQAGRGGATGKVEEFVSLRICGKICRVIRGMFMMSPYTITHLISLPSEGSSSLSVRRVHVI